MENYITLLPDRSGRWTYHKWDGDNWRPFRSARSQEWGFAALRRLSRMRARRVNPK